MVSRAASPWWVRRYALIWLFRSENRLTCHTDALIEESGNPLTGKSQGKEDEPKKGTAHWMNANTGVSRSNNISAPSASVASGSTPSLDKGKGRDGAPSSEAGPSTLRVDKGRAKEVNPLIEPTTLGRRSVDEEIFSPGAAAAQSRLAGLGNAGSLQGDIFGGGGLRGNDPLNSLLGMGGSLGMGGPGMGSGMGRSIGSMGSSPGSPNLGGHPLGALGIPGLGMGGGSGGMGGPGGRLGGMGGLGGGLGDMGSFNRLAESLSGNLSQLRPSHFKEGGGQGAGNDTNNTNNKTDDVNGDTSAQGGATSQSSRASRTGTWSGTGMQSRLSDEGA